jgi:UPF0755 protein
VSGIGDGGDPEGGEVFAPSAPPAQRVTQGHRRRRPRWRRIVLLIGAPVLIVLAAFTLWYELNAHALGPEGKQVVITVGKGESISGVIGSLTKEHVVASSFAFKIGDLVHGDPTVVPGSYALHENQTYGEVRAILNGGPNISLVTVRPGQTLHEVALHVAQVTSPNSTFEKVAASGVVRSIFLPVGSNDLEGLLGTGTYLILPNESDTAILRAMVTRFDQEAAAVGLNERSAAAFGLTPYQLVIVASIVEKEGYVPTSNMPYVARVIYNRLAQGIQLQMDSTVLYALGQDGGPVTVQDRSIQSPYNTYLHKGLTPTPTCIPSSTALSASLHPPAGSWLFFVTVKKDGTEAFATTSAEQLANEQLAKSRGL